MLDKDNRRYLYPFINCINCGPRYTITNAVPYDRHNTTMSVFKMCNECESEYNNTSDRRFHAQPNACPNCGPNLEFKIHPDLFGTKFKIYEKENPIESAINILKQGGIVAIKGLGGFHIACDAANKDAVERLRESKRKNNKPFALMAPDIETIKKYCEVSEKEQELLASNKRPIVLLRKKDTGFRIQDRRQKIMHRVSCIMHQYFLIRSALIISTSDSCCHTRHYIISCFIILFTDLPIHRFTIILTLL